MDKEMQKEDLKTQIERKEEEAFRMRSVVNVWNSGKYKTSFNAEASKHYLQCLLKEIKGLYKQLSLFGTK